MQLGWVGLGHEYSVTGCVYVLDLEFFIYSCEVY